MKRFAILLCASVALLLLVSCGSFTRAHNPPIYVTVDQNGVPDKDPIEITNQFTDIDWTGHKSLKGMLITFDNDKNPEKLDQPTCDELNGRPHCFMDRVKLQGKKNGAYEYTITWSHDGKELSNDPQVIIKR